MQFPPELRYHPEHMWARLNDQGVAQVGISDFAQDQLGLVIYVELPEAGEQVTMGQEMGAVESAKSVSDLISPVTGVVLASNKDLAGAPSTLNEDCYGAGWIAEIKLDDPAQLDSLLDAAAYQAQVS